MNLNQRLKKQLPILGKFGLGLGITALANQITGNPDIAKFLNDLIPGDSNFEATSEVVKGLAAGKLSDYYKEFWDNSNFEINDDLQEAILVGINNALDELQKSFLKSSKFQFEEKKQIKLYFESLTFQLLKELNSENLVKEYIKDRSKFFSATLIKIHGISENDTDIKENHVLEPTISPTSTNLLIGFLITNLEPYIYKYIIEEFKTNKNAKTSYEIHLLEYNAKANSDNTDLLLEIKYILEKYSTKEEKNTVLLQKIAKAQQFVLDSFSKLSFKLNTQSNQLILLEKRISNNLEPCLTVPNYQNLDKSFNYQYGIRYTDFIGRIGEMNQLWDFLNNQPERKLLWWMIKGPGGIGKSRLSLELCLQARNVNRYAGFIDIEQVEKFDWNHWQPQQTTFIVIDYVSTNAESVGKMITTLSRCAQNGLFDKRVRLLLLDRDIRDDWWKKFISNKDIAECSYVSGNPESTLTLPPFDDDDLWEIICEVHRKQNKAIMVTKNEVINRLTEIDPQKRPLFAFITGMALSEGKDIRNWDINDLVSNLLEREENQIWSKYEKWSTDDLLREGHKNLLALTTLTRGLSTSKLKILFKEELTWIPIKKPDSNLYKLLSNISKYTNSDGKEENLYEGLQPDIIGEYYLLKRIQQLLDDDFDSENTIQQLFQCAWELSPNETILTIWQTYSDFKDFKTEHLCNLILFIQPSSKAKEEAWEKWARLQVIITNPDNNFDNKLGAYDNLKNASKQFPHIEKILVYRAMAANNIVGHYGTNNKLEIAVKYLNDLNVISQEFSHIKEIWLWAASATYNIILSYNQNNLMVSAEVHYNNFSKIDIDFGIHKDEIDLNKALMVLSLLITSCNNKQWNSVEHYFDILCNMEIKYNQKEEIFQLIAQAANTIARTYGENQMLFEAKIFYDKLYSMTKQYNITDEIIVLVADSANTLITNYCDELNVNPAISIHKDLSKLSYDFPNIERVKELTAIATYNILILFSDQQIPALADSGYRELIKMNTDNPKNKEIAYLTVQAANNLIVNNGHHKHWKYVEALYKDLSEITSSFIHWEGILSGKAFALCNLVISYSLHQLWLPAESNYGELNKLAVQFAHFDKIQECKANAASKLSISYCKNNLFDLSEEYYLDLSDITNCNLSNEQIVNIKANTAFTMYNIYKELNMLKHAGSYYDDLTSLKNDNSLNQTISDLYLQLSSNIS